MVFPEIGSHGARVPLSNSQIRTNISDQLLLIPGTNATERLGLNVLIEQLLRIQIRTVGQQPEQSHLGSVPLQPATHGARLVHRMLVGNQVDLVFGQAQQAAQEVQD